jgi:hypothetical protein
MPYIYPNVNALGKTPKVGTTECVALVQFYAGVPNHRAWKPGDKVLDNPDIRSGTAIATFVHDRYPDKKTGNHAALFMRHGAPGTGFWAMGQWSDKPGQKPRPVLEQFIPARGMKQNADGSWWNASNTAEAFSIIESR